MGGVGGMLKMGGGYGVLLLTSSQANRISA